MSYFKGIGSKSRSFGGRKLPLIGLIENQKQTIFNKYVPGSGVGASSISARRLKKTRAYKRRNINNSISIPEIEIIEIIEVDEVISFENETIEVIKDIILSKPTLNIDLNNSSNAETHINTIVFIAEELQEGTLKEDDGSEIVEKDFFLNYNVFDEKNEDGEIKIVEQLESSGFTVSVSIEPTISESPDNEYVMKLEFVEGTSIKIVLAENDSYE